MAEGVLSGSDGFTKANSNDPSSSLSTWFDRFTDDPVEVGLPSCDSPSDDELLDSGQLDLDLSPGISPTTDSDKRFPSENDSSMSGDSSTHTHFTVSPDAPLLEGRNGKLTSKVPGVQIIDKINGSNNLRSGGRDSSGVPRNENIDSVSTAGYGRSGETREDDRRQTPRSHCHMGPAQAGDKLARNQLITVVVLCILFMAGEAIGGALANSLALFTDVLHLGSDLISFIISLLAIYLAKKPATKHMSFGFHRAEVLGALFSVFIIWLVSGILCYMAVERIVHEHYKNVKANEMLITASVGVIFNLIMGFVLHSERCCNFGSSHRSFGHNHSHGSGHGHTHSKRNEYQPLHQVVEELSDSESDYTEHSHRHKNINVRAAFIHVVGDIIQSLGVFVAALIIKFTSDERFKLADPICTFLFSLLVLITTIAVLRDTLRVMMEGVPRDLSYESVKKDLNSVDGVMMVHSLHVWSLTIDRNSLAVHLAVEEGTDYNEVLSTATSMVRRNHNISYVTIQVELFDHDIMSKCAKCQEPRDCGH